MKNLNLAVLILMFVFVAGCKNPLGGSSSREAGFSPGYTDTANEATKLGLSLQPVSSVAGQALRVTVRLLDADDAVVTASDREVAVALAGSPVGVTLSGTKAITTSSGVATFADLSLDKVGSGYTLVFTSAGIDGVTSAAFDIAAAAPSAARSTMTTSATAILADGVASSSFTITLKDEYENPVVGQNVTLVASAAGATITQPTVATDASGMTTASVVGSTSGSKTFSITNPGGLATVSATVNFLNVNLAQTWAFDSANSMSHTLSGPSLEYTASLLRHRDLSVDSDNHNTYGFGAAESSTNLAWSNGLGLSAAGLTAGTGNMVSRHIVSAANTAWTNLAFTSLIPAGKRYPANRGVETAYASNNVDMANNLILLPMDETAWAGGTTYDVADQSGRSHPARVVGAVAPSTAQAKFGSSALFSGGYMEVAPAAELSGMTNMSYEAWIRPATGNIDGVNAVPLIAYRSGMTTSNYAFSAFAYTNKYLVIDINGNATGTNRFTTSYIVQENVWQHIAITFTGSTKVLRLYVNGTNVWSATTNHSAINSVAMDQAGFYIGSMKGNGGLFRGHMDQVAFYSRALTGAEVTARYQRGLLRMKFQVRACTATCTTEPFVGPDGTSGSYWTEFLNSGVSNVTSVALSGFASEKDFQYKTILETDLNTVSPKLGTVTVTPTVYDIGSPSVTSSDVAFSQLQSFTASAGGAGTIRFQLIRDGSPYYHDGTRWVAATLGSHTNTEAQVNANIRRFHLDIGAGTLRVRALFGSGTNATNQATLTSVSVTGNQ